MSTSASSAVTGASSSSSSLPPPPPKIDLVLRIVLRYTFSSKEYAAVHRRLIQRSPNVIRKQAPSPASYEAALAGRDDFNAAAVRASIRLFVASKAGLKLWEKIKEAIARRRNNDRLPPVPQSLALLSADTRLSISLSLLLLSHRLLYRFASRLRAHILHPSSKPFRRRNPKVSRALASRLAPAIVASLAGFAFAVTPAEQLRLTIAIYAGSRAAEFLWNALEAEGWFERRPAWFGSWLLMPGVLGQLLYAFVFERDCFPAPFGNFILRFSDTYVQKRPADYPEHLPWPSSEGIVAGLAEIARMHYPAFESPIIHTGTTLPPNLASISPITSPAHPAHTHLACALIHPSNPSCTRTYISFFGQALPRFARLFAAIFTVLSLPRYKAFLADPITEVNTLAERVMRAAAFFTGGIGTSWASICLFQALLPRGAIPRGRYFVGGAMGGLWAYLVKERGRSQFLYCARLAIDSGYKVGFKKGWWKGGRGGDLWVVVASLAVLNAVYDRNPEAVSSGVVRRVVGGLRGTGWRDKVKEMEKREKGKGKGKEE